METFIAKHGKLGEGFSKKEIMDADEHPGRRTTPHGYQSPAAWISDLVARKQCVLLCPFDRIKFDHRKYHYRKMYIPNIHALNDGYMANGKCDACKEQTSRLGGGTAYVHEETYNLGFIDPLDARRQARAKARAQTTAWQLIQRRG